MIINRKSLDVALKLATKIVPKNPAVEQIKCVLIDAENQRLLATDMTDWLEVPLWIKSDGVSINKEQYTEHINSMTAKDIEKLIADKGYEPVGKKAVSKGDLVEHIVSQATKELQPENYVIALDDLCRIVSRQKTSVIEITPEGMKYDPGEDRMVSETVSINGVFQGVPLWKVWEYPVPPDVVRGQKIVTLTKNQVSSLVEHADPSDPEERPHLLNLVIDGEKNNVLATDSARLARLDIEVNYDECEMVGASMLKKFIKQDVHIFNTNGPYLAYDFDVCVITARKNEADFPDTTDFVVTGDYTSFEVDPNLIVSALNEIAGVSESVYLRPQVSGLLIEGSMTLFPAKRHVDGIGWPDVDLLINLKKLLSTLKCCNGRTVMHVKDASSALFISKDSFTFAIMPMRE